MASGERAVEAVGERPEPGLVRRVRYERLGRRFRSILPILSAPSEDAAPGPVRATTRRESEKTWIEIELVDEDGEKVVGEKYRLQLPDGTVQEGTTGGSGLIRVADIDPGMCKVSFPGLKPLRDDDRAA